jgi:hypothetical protein
MNQQFNYPSTATPTAKLGQVTQQLGLWQEGDTVWVGDEARASINVFAGLFLYEGQGIGTYYARSGNEIVRLRTATARALARAEGIPIVDYDSSRWTSDPTLADQRQRAQESFDLAKVQADRERAVEFASQYQQAA